MKTDYSTAEDGSERPGSARLGYLSEGAFFGEAPVLAAKNEGSMQLRMRTVLAVTQTELCWITRDDVLSVCEDYPELQARIVRFRNSARVLTNRTLKKLGFTDRKSNVSVLYILFIHPSL